MGCCVSKCKPTRKPQFISGVQDKLVISQSPPSSPPQKRKQTQYSPPSTASGNSLSCSTNSSTCGSSSLSSASSASSLAFSKVDRTFSNDFLHSCAMENPQIIGLDPIKKIGVVKQVISPGTTNKRPRAGSPTVTRQKSFRIEKERLMSSNGRTIMRSPSPSRRFNGSSTITSNYQRPSLTNTRSECNRAIKAHTRPSSPNRNVISKQRPLVCLKNIKDRSYEYEVGEVLNTLSYSGSAVAEDLDNPHIALDCFIFL